MDTAQNSQTKKLLTISQAAKYLRVSLDSLRRWDKKKILSPIRTPGQQRRYTKQQLDEFLLNRHSKNIYIQRPEEPDFSNEDVNPIASSLKNAYKAGTILIRIVSSLKSKAENISPNVNPKPQEEKPPLLAPLPSRQILFASAGLTAVVFGIFLLYPAFAGIIGSPSKPEFLKVQPLPAPNVLGITTSELNLNGNIRFNLPATFAENVVVEDKNLDIGTGELTASNVIYSLTAGSGIAITAGQTPAISSLDTLALVTGRGATTTTELTLSGGANLGNLLTFASLSSDPTTASNGDIFYNTTSNKFRCYINGTWSNCDTDTTSSGDITAVSVGNGLSGGGSSGDVTVSLDVTTTSTSTTTTANSGLETGSSGLSLLRGCSTNQTLVWDGTTDIAWKCSAIGAGGITADSLDFTEFQDTLDLDADLTLNQTTYTWSQSFTGTTTDAFTLTASSLTTGTALTLTGPSSTGVTDHFAKLTSDIGSAASLLLVDSDFSGSGVTAYGIYNDADDNTSSANTDYGYYGGLDLTGNVAKTATGIYQTVTSTSTTGDTLYAIDILTDHNAAVTTESKTLFGIRSRVSNNGITDTNGATIYAGYFLTAGNTGGTSDGIGVYAQTGGSDNNYNFYSAIATTDVDVGYLVEAPSNANLPINFTGLYVNLASNTTTSLANANAHNGVNVLQDTVSVSSGDNSLTAKGFTTTATSLTSSGTYTGTMNWYGYDVTTPNLTDGGGTLNAYGAYVTTGSITTDGNQYGVNIAATGVGAGTLYGINVSTITGSGGTETGIAIGSGWDDAININSGEAIIESSGVVSIDLENTATAFGLCHSGTDVDAATDTTRDIVACDSAPGDLAEWYETKEGVEAGDIVSTSDETITYSYTPLDPFTGTRKEGQITNQTASILQKSPSANNNNIIGIVSTSPYQTFGNALKDAASHPQPIALAGRVPVKVSNENGPILKGDYITSSSTTGVGMKATKPGPVVGKALENFPASQGETLQGKILVFVNPSFADPTSLFANLSIGVDGSLIVPQENVSFAEAPTNGQIASDPTENQKSTYDLAQDPLFNNLSSKVDALTSRSSELESEVASISAQQIIDQSTSQQPSTELSQAALSTQHAIVDLLEAKDATVSGQLNVLGRSVLSDVGITGDLSIGLITVHGLDGEINTLAGDLKLQNNSLGGIDILAGKITIDNNGNMTSQGTIVAKAITTEKLTIISPDTASSSSVLAASIGSATILAGQTEAKIPTSAVTHESKIFVTAQNNLSSPLFVSDKTPTEGFTVKTTQAEGTDVNFDWWIVETR